MLGHDIYRIFFTEDLSEVDSSAADNLLDPQNVGIQVPHFAQALP